MPKSGGTEDLSGDVSAADMKARGDFDSPVAFELMPELEASFEAGACLGQRVEEFIGNGGSRFVGLNDAELGAQAGGIAKVEALLDADLRLPEPQVACGGQG